MTPALFPDANPLAAPQPKTDRPILARLVDQAALDTRLKDAASAVKHRDRDRAGGRTAVDPCWDYLVNTPPACRWGIVSNFVSFRLYERDSTKRRYEHFTLQSLRDFKVLRPDVAKDAAN